MVRIEEGSRYRQSRLALDHDHSFSPKVFVDFTHRCSQSRAHFHDVGRLLLSSVFDGLTHCPTPVVYENVVVMNIGSSPQFHAVAIGAGRTLLKSPACDLTPKGLGRRCERLFRSEVNFFRHVAESDLIMSENIVSPENVSGSSSGEESHAAGELIGVGLQLDAHF